MSLPRGNTLIINYTNQDNAGNPISLSGATIYFTAKPSPGYDSVANDSTATWQVTSSGNTGNTCTLTVPATKTWVAPATYYWDITIQYTDGSVVTPLTGTILISGIATNIAS
jgi:hypothetical protein